MIWTIWMSSSTSDRNDLSHSVPFLSFLLLFQVFNNGKGIPVVMHKDEKMYVPTMIFGHLLTSSNFNDEDEKVTGGRNGYGAKLCNVFSTKFTVTELIP